VQLICDAGFIFLEPKRRKGRIVLRQIWSKKGVILGGQKRVFLGGGSKNQKMGGPKFRYHSTEMGILLRGNAPDVKKAKIAPLEAIYDFSRPLNLRFFQRTLVHFRGRVVWRRF